MSRPRSPISSPLRAALPAFVLCASLVGQKHDESVPEELGELAFPVSTEDPVVQAAFERATLLLHSFEYEDAREVYRDLQQREPELAIAYWGEAMTHYRPIWRQEDVEDARAVLARLAPTPAARRELAGSDVERGLLGTVEVLFGEGTRNERWTGYRDALAELSRRHPHHVEIGAFHMLSVLGSSLDGRDTRMYMQAAAIGEHFYRREPRHPGLLHYLIHSYDDPIHAPLGLRMARAYDKVAPGAEHALHMPSHIYLALGMWPETVAANIRSVAAADARRERKGLGPDARGWHAFLWLAYAHLQLGEFDAARALLAECGRFVDEHGSKRIRAHFAQLRALLAIDTRAFDDELVRKPVDTTDLPGHVRTLDLWVRGRILLADGDDDAFDRLVAGIPVEGIDLGVATSEATAAASCCAPGGGGERPEAARARAITGLLLRAARAERDDDLAAASALYRRAADAEDGLPLDFGPPESVPAHEEYAAFLERTGEGGAAARAAWQAALRRAPGRRRATSALEDEATAPVRPGR
jgi:tetratricopeptide (TPR) repeat protein